MVREISGIGNPDRHFFRFAAQTDIALGLQVLQNLLAVHIGHLQVQQKPIGRSGCQGIESLKLIGRFGHAAALFSDAPLKGIAGDGDIIDYQYV